MATRPVENNGLGMGVSAALGNIARFRSRASLIAETVQASELFLEWTASFGIRGKRLYDLRLLTSASVVGMDGSLTANKKIFRKPATSGFLRSQISNGDLLRGG